MPDAILMETGDSLLEEGGGLLLLESSLATPRVIRIASFETFPGPTYEKTTPLVEATLTDENDERIDTDALLAVLLQVHDDESGTIVRDYEDVLLSGSDVTIVTDEVQTLLTWLAQVQDTELVDRENYAQEARIATWQFLFGTAANSGTSGASPFATVTSSKTVTVTITSHGMAATEDHNVFFGPGATVGGVSIAGSYNVKAEDISDPDTFTITVDCAATGTTSGGGARTWWTDARTNVDLMSILIDRAGPTC